jgi:hypothetical protein
LNEPRQERRRRKKVRASAELGIDAGQEIEKMRRHNASNLKGNDAGVHEQAGEQHAVWHGLRWHGEEEEARLLPTLVLDRRVAKSHVQTVQKERPAGEVLVERLGKELAGC